MDSGMSECKQFGCQNESRTDGMDSYANKFCSDECEVKYDHIKMDAKDAMQSDLV